MNIYEIMSDQEIKIMYLERKGKDSRQIARTLKVTRNQVRVVKYRIKQKIKRLEAEGVGYEFEDDSVESIFREAQERSLPKKTVKQACFLANIDKMHLNSLSARERRNVRTMQKRLGISKKEDEIIRVSNNKKEQKKTYFEMREKIERIRKNPGLGSLLRKYEEEFGTATNIREMANMEIILRAHGLIVRTPYINKLNRKTSERLRAQGNGKKVVVLKSPEERYKISPDAKYIETYRDEDTWESIWVV